ncbi:MAG: glycosyltransferase family 4 protein [Porticoccus sp.]|nr:glycosyltransferase family 4 protein [Porticoccus sp.]
MSPVPEKTRKIHVLQVVGDPVGGIRKHIHSIVSGVDSVKFVQSYAHSITSVDAKFERDLVQLKQHLECVIPLSVKKRPGLRDLINLYILVKYVRAAKVDIIHGHGAKGGLYARTVGRICGVKSVYTPHGGVAHSMFSKAEEMLYTFVEKILYGWTDCFVFESNYTAQAFHKKIGCSSGCWMVNYNGVSTPDVGSALNQVAVPDNGLSLNDALHVGVFGLLRAQKGQEYAIRAVSQLKEKNKSICLHVYGDGPDREKLVSLSKSIGVSDRVIFHGDVTDVEMHMSRMDVILVPSLFESFGYVAIEAMVLEKPVIVSSVGGLMEVVDNESGIFIQPGNVDAITQALLFCLDHPEQIKVKALRGKKRAESEFSLDRMIERISTIYQNLILPAGVR